MAKKEPSGEIRLQKFLSEQGICSRRMAEQYILEGRVKVNGIIAQIGQKVNPEHDRVNVGNKFIRPQQRKPITLLMNKPRGVICSNDDPHNNRTVFDILPPELQKQKLFCAGRLDKDSEGLLIITNDGELANHITHPSSQLTKRYRVLLSKPFEERHTRRLLQGIEDEGEFLRADKVIPLNEGVGAEKRLEIHLHHGRKREIRRLLEACGYFVKRLKRFQIGDIGIKGLGVRGIRPLTDKEIQSLLKASNKTSS